MRKRLAVAASVLLGVLLLAALLLGRRDRTPADRAEADGAAPSAVRGAPPPSPPSLPVAAPAVVTPVEGPGTFEGFVLSEGTGAGVAGAELTFSRAGAAASVRSGPDGSFRFEPPRPGPWQLATATAPGHLPFAPEWGHSPVLLTARNGKRVSGLAVWLRPAVPYAGRVLDSDRRPVAGAEVRLLGAGAGEQALVPLPGRFTTDAAGDFTFSAPDGAVLEAHHPGHEPGRARVDFAARVARRLVIVLGGPAGEEAGRAAIAGRVTGVGAPLEGALVTARRQRGRGPGSAGDPVAQATSDGDGRFTLPDLAAGTYLVSASSPGFTTARAPGVVAGAGDVALDLSRGGRVTGRVRSRRDGGAVAPFTVVIRRAGGRGARLSVASVSVVDPTGRFELDGLAPGPSLLQVSSPFHAPSEEVAVEVPEPPGVAEVEVLLAAGGELPGRVVERGSGRALPGARVEVEGVDAPGSALGSWSATVAGPDGAFLLRGLPDRPVSLFVSADGHHARILSGVQAPENGRAPPVTVELGPVQEGEDPHVELAGIGAVLEPRGRGAVTLRSLVPGGGAAEAGLQPGDEVVAVDGQSVADLGGLPAVVERIRGPENTRVVLTVRRGDTAPADVWVWRRIVRG